MGISFFTCALLSTEGWIEPLLRLCNTVDNLQVTFFLFTSWFFDCVTHPLSTPPNRSLSPSLRLPSRKLSIFSKFHTRLSATFTHKNFLLFFGFSSFLHTKNSSNLNSIWDEMGRKNPGMKNLLRKILFFSLLRGVEEKLTRSLHFSYVHAQL